MKANENPLTEEELNKLEELVKNQAGSYVDFYCDDVLKVIAEVRHLREKSAFYRRQLGYAD